MQFSSKAVTALKPQTPRTRGLAWRLGGALTCAALVTGALAQGDAPATGGAGLKGLLPASAPEGLMETLSTLPESWKDWSDGVSADLTKFYSETAEDVAGQRAALEGLKNKVGIIEKALADPQYAPIEGPLVALKNGLIRRIEVVEAALDTLSGDPAAGAAAAIGGARTGLGAATDAAEVFLDGLKGGDGWKAYLQTGAVKSALAADGDEAKLLEALGPISDKASSAADSADTTVKDFVAHPELKAYVAKLASTVATLKRSTAGVNMDEVRAQLKSLLEGLENYESTGTTGAATQVRTAFSKLREQAADGGDRLSMVLRQYYFNYNMQVSISEGFFNRVLAKTHIEEGGVNDFILGANVYGCQITSSRATFDLLRSENGAKFCVHLTGTVTTNTDSHKGRVTIFSNGNHSFVAQKQIIFDGERFSTTPADMHVNASNEPVDASTPADNIPVFGNVFKTAAMNAAIKKRPEAEAIAAQRVTSRVGPEFDNEVDNKFGEINQKLESKLNAPLKAEGLYPESRHYQSSDTQFDFHSRLMADGELGGSKADIRQAAEGELVYQMHESLINNFMDRLGVNGKTMNEPELRKLLEDKLSKLLSKEVTLPKPEQVATDDAKQPKAFIFTEKDPLRIHVADGKINLIIRAGFQRDEAQGGNIPPQVVTIPLSFTLEGEEVVITRGDVSVDALDTPDNVAEQVARAGVIKKKLETTVQATKRDSRTMKIDKPEGEPINVNVTGIEANDGWVTIRLK